MQSSLVALMLAVYVLAVSAATPAASQPADDTAKLRQEIEALKAGQQALRKDLEDVKALLRARLAAPPASGPTPAEPVSLAIDGAPFRGSKHATVTLVEFSDFQCAFCARHSQQTLPAILKDYVDTGKVKYVMRDFPIASLHPQAQKAHEAAHCAGEQGKYWELHPLLFGNIKAQSPPQLLAHARTLRLDGAKFEQCLASGRHGATVQKALAEGQRAGVRGTPTFFVGAGDGRTVQATQMLRGAQPYERFKVILDAALANGRPAR